MYNDRLTMENYLSSYWMDTHTFATAPPTLKNDFSSFLAPFNNSIWLLILAMFVLIICLNQLNTLLENGKYFPNKNHHRSRFDLWILICILCRQNYVSFKQLNRSMKFIFVLTIIGWIFITNFYFGYLCSMFSFPKFSVINTLDKLMKACQRNQLKTISVYSPCLRAMLKVNIIIFSFVFYSVKILIFLNKIISSIKRLNCFTK